MDRPALAMVAELLEPITWFPPMWAIGCGGFGMPLLVVGTMGSAFALRGAA